MKHAKRIFSITLIIALVAVILAFPVSAKNIQDYQNSVVCIGSRVVFTASNIDYYFSTSSTGTGFAVGEPGKPVEYIGTCAHVVSEPEGIYTVLIDAETGSVVDRQQEEEGTAYPARQDYEYNGKQYLLIRDYFSTETVDLYAIFSNSTNDYTTLTVAQINNDVDLALCKLASQPTEKIKALPIQLKEDIEVNTDVIAIGYPSTSRVFNSENRFDASDSTVKDGIISKRQRTTGMMGSKTTFDAYEVTAELITGMSGGPVISEDSGAIVGVTAFTVTDTSQAAAARYAICIDYLTKMLDSEGIDYKLAGSVNLLAIALICIGVSVVVAAIVVLVILLIKKRSSASPAPVYEPQPAPVSNDAPVAAPAAPVNNGGSNAGKYYMYGIAGPLNGKKYGITSTAVIGRDSTKCNVVFAADQAGVSGVHCEIRISDGLLTLRDCGSSYGTYLENGNKLDVNIPVVIPTGTKFYLGSEKIGFEVRY